MFVFQHWDQMPSAMSHKHTQAANLQPIALLSTIVARTHMQSHFKSAYCSQIHQTELVCFTILHMQPAVLE